MTSQFFHSFKSEIKNNLSLSIPLIAAQLIYASSGFIGTAMIARLGEDALAASVLVSTIWMSLTVLFFGLLNSISVLVSHQYGAKNYSAISKIMGQSFLLGIIVSILMILMLFLMPGLLSLTDQPPKVIEMASQYTYSLLWTTPGLILLVIYEQFLAGINRAKIVLRISFLVVPVEIPIIYVLIFGKFGLPQLGVAGIGYGFAITYTITALGMTYYFLKSRYYRHFNIFGAINWLNLPTLKELIIIGLPMGFMHVMEVTTLAICTIWVARFSTTLLAAHQLTMQYLFFAITLTFAMAQTVSVRVGHEVGRLNKQGIQYAVGVGLFLDTIYMLIVAAAFYLFPYTFLRLDLDVNAPANALLVKEASLLFAICGVSMIFDNFRIIGFGALRGLKDTKYPMYTSLVAFWGVTLVAAYILGFVYDFEAAGIWWGLTIGIFVGAVLMMIRLYYIIKHLDENKLRATLS